MKRKPTTPRTWWRRQFAAASKTNDWYRVPRLYSVRTAQQISTDIRAGHRRELGRRCVGFPAGQRWEARWTIHSAGQQDVCWIDIRLEEELERSNADSQF